jgi:hypothetical protein
VPASETGRGCFALWKQFARASRAFRYARCPVLFPPLRCSAKSPCHLPREVYLKVTVELHRGMREMMDRQKNPEGTDGRLRRDTLAGTLPAKFIEEVILLQRGPLAQQFEQWIFERLRG